MADQTVSMRKVFAAFATRPMAWWSMAALFSETQLHNSTLRAALARLVQHGWVQERGLGPQREFQLTAPGRSAAPAAAGMDAPTVTLAQLRAEVESGVTDPSVLNAALRATARKPDH